MMSGPSWLYEVGDLAGASLIGAIYVAGLVVMFRRWHLGMAARLGAIGFGLLLLFYVAGWLFNLLTECYT